MIHKAIEENPSPFEEMPFIEPVEPILKKDSSSQNQEPQTPRLSGARLLLLGVGIGVALTMAATRFLSTPQQQKSAQTVPAPAITSQSPAQSVTIAPVNTTSVNRTLKATGTVAAFELISVLSQATGLQIQQVLVDEGDFVQAGQVIVILDAGVGQARLAQAQAAVAQAEARVAELRAGNRAEEIARARESVKMAKADLTQAQSDWDLAKKRVERNRNLQVEGAIALDRLDEFVNDERSKKAIVQQLQAKVRETQQQLLEFEAGPRPQVIAQAVAQLAEAKAQVQLNNAQLKDTRVVAPVSGKVATRNARVGDVTSSSQALFTIIENGRLELQVKLPETDLPLIRPGQKVTVSSDADSRLQLLGTIREINPTVNEESRQATLKIDLPAQASLKPGMFLRAAITTSTATSLTIPMGAVLPQANGQSIVYLLQADKTVKAQPVTTGEILANEQVEILKGLTQGDRVIVKGAAFLADGDRVSVNSDPESGVQK